MSDSQSERREDWQFRGIVDRLKDEDARQNHRLRDLEDTIAVIRADIHGLWNQQHRTEVALTGPNGDNGIRGTMMEHYATTTERLANVETSVKGLADSVSQVAQDVRTLDATLRTISKAFAAVGGLIATTGIIIGIITTL